MDWDPPPTPPSLVKEYERICLHYILVYYTLGGWICLYYIVVVVCCYYSYVVTHACIVVIHLI